MLVEEVDGERPAQDLEAGHFRPQRVADDERVGADVEGRGRAELSPPQMDGAHVLQVLVQHVCHHAQRLGELAGVGLELEIDDDDLVEVSAAHVGSCLAPIRRSRPGCVSSMIMRPAKVRSISSLSG